MSIHTYRSPGEENTWKSDTCWLGGYLAYAAGYLLHVPTEDKDIAMKVGAADALHAAGIAMLDAIDTGSGEAIAEAREQLASAVHLAETGKPS